MSTNTPPSDAVPLTGRLSDAGQDALEAAWLAVADTGDKISLVAADEGTDRDYEERAAENARRRWPRRRPARRAAHARQE